MESEWLTDRCFTVDKRDRLTKVLGWIAGDRRDAPVVCDDGRPYGIVDARRIMNGRPHARSAIRKVDWPVPVVGPTDSPETALGHFAHTHAPYLPAKEGKTTRILTAERLLDAFDDGPTAEQAMGRVPVFTATDDVEAVLHGFGRNAITELPFADGRGPRGVIRREEMVQYFLEPEQSIGKDDRAGEGEPVRDDPLTGLVDERIRTLAPETPFVQTREVVQEGPAFVVRDNRIEGAVTAAYLLAGVHEHRRRDASPAAVRQVARR